MALDIGGDREVSRKEMEAEVPDAETELPLVEAGEKKSDEKALH